MIKNKVKWDLKDGKTSIGTFLNLMKDPEAVRILGDAGFDFFVVDAEHSPYNEDTARLLMKEGRATGIMPFMRVPDPIYHFLARALDSGAMGLIIPRVETKEQVERIIESTKFPPWGRRGSALRPVALDYESTPVQDYIVQANRETMIAIQIESSTAIERIDDLLSVEGVDAAFIGPNDLSINLGIPGKQGDPKMFECVKEVIEACKRHDAVPGCQQNDLELLIEWMKMGITMASYGSEVVHLKTGAEMKARKMRQAAVGAHS